MSIPIREGRGDGAYLPPTQMYTGCFGYDVFIYGHCSCILDAVSVSYPNGSCVRHQLIAVLMPNWGRHMPRSAVTRGNQWFCGPATGNTFTENMSTRAEINEFPLARRILFFIPAPSISLHPPPPFFCPCQRQLRSTNFPRAGKRRQHRNWKARKESWLLAVPDFTR